jgi:hypothetical protein
MKDNQAEPAAIPLAEAIRLGAMLGPQVRGTFFRKRNGEVQTCALGAAADALGAEKPGLFPSLQMWPILSSLVAEEEMPGELRAGSVHFADQTLMGTIMHLNDVEGWTRTEIADWVEQYEQRHPAETRATALFELPADSPDEPDEEIPVACAC